MREVSRRLPPLGDDVTVYASDLYDESRWLRRSDFPVEVDRIPVRRFPVYRRLIPGLTMPMMVGLVKGLDRDRPDVIHAHSHRYGHVLQAAAIAEARGIPLVVSTHYHPADRGEPPLKRGLLRCQDVGFGMTAYRVARTLVVETELEARLVREFAPAEKIRVIPPGIDLDAWRVAPATPAGLLLPPRYLLYSGRIASNKGLGTLLRAIAELPSSDRLPLVMMGEDWGERPRLEREAAALGISDWVQYLGHVGDPSTYQAVFRRADLFILPSEWEAFGLVLLEAMAAGRPIIASAVGGVPEVLENGRSGRLVPYGDATALARTIGELLRSPDERARLADSGRARVEGLTWDRTAAAHHALYRELAVAG